VDHGRTRRVRDYGGPVGTSSAERTFEVVAWPAERRLVLYVPEIEAATTVVAMSDADDAARSLIADLTGLDARSIRCDIRLGRRGSGPTP
jgi:hypothetical protein